MSSWQRIVISFTLILAVVPFTGQPCGARPDSSGKKKPTDAVSKQSGSTGKSKNADAAGRRTSAKTNSNGSPDASGRAKKSKKYRPGSPAYKIKCDFDQAMETSRAAIKEKNYINAIKSLDKAIKLSARIPDQDLMLESLKAQVFAYESEIERLKKDSWLWTLPDGMLLFMVAIPVILVFGCVAVGALLLLNRMKASNELVVGCVALILVLAGFFTYSTIMSTLERQMHIQAIEDLNWSLNSARTSIRQIEEFAERNSSRIPGAG